MRTKRLSALFFVLMSALFLTVAMTSGARNAPLAEGDATSIAASDARRWRKLVYNSRRNRNGAGH